MARSLFIISPDFINRDELVRILGEVTPKADLKLSIVNKERIDINKGVYNLLELYLGTESDFLSDKSSGIFKKEYGHLFLIVISDNSDGSNNKGVIPFLKELLAKMPSFIIYNEEAEGQENVRLFDKTTIDSLPADADYYAVFYKAV